MDISYIIQVWITCTNTSFISLFYLFRSFLPQRLTLSLLLCGVYKFLIIYIWLLQGPYVLSLGLLEVCIITLIQNLCKFNLFRHYFDNLCYFSWMRWNVENKLNTMLVAYMFMATTNHVSLLSIYHFRICIS
jgi:hypothetical protein